MDPKDLTVSLPRCAPVVDGAAGEEERSGFGESTVPKAKFPAVSPAESDGLPLLMSTPLPTSMLPFRECVPTATGTLFPLASACGCGVPEGLGDCMAEVGLDAVARGGPRDQAEEGVDAPVLLCD